MPQAIAGAVIAGLAASVTTSAITTGVFVFGMSNLIAFGGSLLVSGASMLMSKKPKSAAATVDSGITTTIRSSNATREIVYGQIRVGGTLIYATTSNKNQYLHWVVALADHEVHAIDEVLLDDESIPTDALDANGNVTTGKFTGYLKIKKHTGAGLQAADPSLMGVTSEWTANHRLRGVAYLYLRMQYHVDKYPTGIPNISAVVRGKRVLDTRDGISRLSVNPALLVRDYLANPDFGFESADFIDDASVTASANVCDEIVDTVSEAFAVASVSASGNTLTMTGDLTKLSSGDRVQVASTGSLPAGLSAATDYYVSVYQFYGTPRIKLATSYNNAMRAITIDLTTAGSGTITVTKTGEPRFSGSCVLSREATLGDNLVTLLTAFGGKAVYAGGRWRVLAAAYEAPTVTLDEDDFVAPLQINTKIRRSDRFNAIQGLYVSHINRGQSTDYPEIVDDAAVVRDAQKIVKDYDLGATYRPATAQRLAKIELKKAVQEISVEVTCTLKALQVQCGETVALTNARMGWSAKPFEVVGLSFALAAEQLAVKLSLRETSADIYNWATSEESVVDTAPNTTLPSVFDIDPPDGLAFDSFAISTDGGDTVFQIRLSWNAHEDAFVHNGGQFEIQYKPSTEAQWQPSFFVAGDLTSSNITSARVGEAYDIQIRALNNIGVRSGWATISGVISGSSGGAGSSADWGGAADAVTVTDDWGGAADAVTVTDDWGAI